MSNYYVRRTGDDSNYLAHANGFKYLTKINVGGKVRYIYNQAQLAAARAGRTVADATGLTARRAYQSAKKARIDAASSRSGRQNTNLQRAAGRAKKAYNKTLLGRIENAGNAAGKFVGRQATRARNAGKSFAGTVSREAYRLPGRAKNFVDRNITGASAKRGMKVNNSRYENLSRSNKRSDNSKASLARKNAKSYEKKYRQSLAGRIDNAANAARTFVGQQANRARAAGESFAGTVSKEAYRVGRRTKRKVNGLFAPKKAPRKPAKEVNVRDYAKINRSNEKSAEQYQYFNKDAGWATNSRAAAKRLTGHTTHNRSTAKRKRRTSKRRSQSQRRTIQ